MVGQKGLLTYFENGREPVYCLRLIFENESRIVSRLIVGHGLEHGALGVPVGAHGHEICRGGRIAHGVHSGVGVRALASRRAVRVGAVGSARSYDFRGEAVDQGAGLVRRHPGLLGITADWQIKVEVGRLGKRGWDDQVDG